MCGIAGFYGFRDDNLIKKISKEIEHRGPDGEGYYFNDNLTLLNRRLAIIDLKEGDQPIYNEDKSTVVVYNGEIYNYRELRQILEEKGHKFYTHSDTEVIVHSYDEWGKNCFDKFNGMFAIALYDLKNKKLILTRDHFGIKPLYYSILGDKKNIKIIFCSEIKPIIESGYLKKQPNDRIIYRYLMYRIHDDQKETFFKNIYRLMPGQLMEVQNSKFKIQNYSNLRDKLGKLKQNCFDKDKVCEFKEELFKAIKYRLISDVPVGTCLSGGLDSSTVVAVVNKLLGKEEEAQSVGKIQNTFSAVFPGSDNNEEIYIDSLTKKIKNIRSHKIYPKPEVFFRELEDFVRTQEEPTISTGPYAQYKVMKEAASSVKVLLDGQGADEMMAGYLPYYFVFMRQLVRKKQYLKLAKETMASFDIVGKYTIFKILTKLGIKQEIKARKLLRQSFVAKYADEKFKIESSNLKKRLMEDIFENSLPSLLRYEDRNSMKFSIEGRVPFLDMNLLSLVFSLDDEAIIKDGWNKNILRQSVADLLPENIVKRRNKIGFTTPEQEWFMRMKNRIYAIFLSESFAKRPYFNQAEVLKAFQKFIEGKTDDTMLFWRLLNLEIWLRVFFGSEERAAGPPKGKRSSIVVGGAEYYRLPIRTDLIKKGDDIKEKINEYLTRSIDKSNQDGRCQNLADKKWFVAISEKIIAIAQGRSFFIWDIRAGFWAKLLSRFVKKTPYGIGLGSPWTMQLAIQEAGFLRILLASVASIITKPFGIKGVFYQVAGRETAAIDGPTEYSLYPSNVSAKLGPKDPQKVAEEIHFHINSKLKIQNFLGVVIIDANDLGQNVLGNSTNLPNLLIEKIFADNPMGQADEQTPLVLVFK